jgi:hypothetical protein
MRLSRPSGQGFLLSHVYACACVCARVCGSVCVYIYTHIIYVKTLMKISHSINYVIYENILYKIAHSINYVMYAKTLLCNTFYKLCTKAHL